ncbi:MAG: diguanylate cyclase [Nitrospinae bacterium]|nr:diguanylate cyclase [Nitrospinota bacterium]
MKNIKLMTKVFATAFMAGVLLFPGAGRAQKQAPEAPVFSWLEDTTRRLTLDGAIGQARAGKFAPIGESEPNFGYSKSAFWLHASLKGVPGGSPDWMLEIPFPTLDKVEVFFVDPSSGKVIKSHATGDTVPFAQRPYPHRNFVFPLRLAPENRVDVFIRVESQGSLTVGTLLWPADLFHHASRGAYMALLFYFGALTALFAYNLLLYISLLDRSYLYYILFVGSMAVGQMSWNGLGYEYLWPDFTIWGNVASVAGFDAAGFFGAVFSREFLGVRRSAPALDKLLAACQMVFAALFITIPATPYQINAIATSATGVVFAAAASASGVVCLVRGFSAARYFLLAWSMLLVGVAALGSRNLGWLPTNFFTKYSMLIGSGLEMLLLSFALADRVNALRKEKELAQADAYSARLAMIEALTRTERELEAKVAERTRELTDVNSRLAESANQLRKMAHHDPLTGLANRILLDETLGLAVERTRRHNGRLAVFLVDLDGFKLINDTHGHDAGDSVLVATAQTLKNCVRASDTVARLGGDEFVLVLDELANPAAAEHIARKIVEEINSPVIVKGGKLQISGSLGAAIFPEDGDDSDTLINMADRAMYNAKLAGRNQVSFAEGFKGALKNGPETV